VRRAPLAVATALLLSGCSAPEPTNGTSDPFDEHKVTLRDGSTVTCLTYDRALDCDWSGR
jgi:hypothetical protein